MPSTTQSMTVPPFNQVVKALRQQAHLTQSQLAQALDCTSTMVSHWEHGAAISARYRQKLCEYFSARFGQSAETLGLVLPVSAASPVIPTSSGFQSSPSTEAPDKQHDHSLTLASDKPALLDSELLMERQGQPKSIADHCFPTTLPDPLADDDLIGRQDLLATCRERLKCSRFLALYGLPGVGKSTLAVKLAHDRTLRRRFPGGILFAALGPEPDIAGLLGSWGAQLGIVSAAAANVVDAETWGRAIHATIGERRLLLIIDDAWTIEHLAAFKVGGPNCRYVMTTRFPRLATAFAGAEPESALAVHELTEARGYALLARLAPQVVQAEPRAARALERAVGGLPLALTLMGNYLRMESLSGQPRRIQAALRLLRSTKERLHLAQAQGPAEQHPTVIPGTALSLQAVLDMSINRIRQQDATGEQRQKLTGAEACRALHALTIFPPKPSSFSEEAAQAVCAVPLPAFDLLSDWGLLEAYGPGRYTLHQVIHDYARLRLGNDGNFTDSHSAKETPDAATHQRLVEFYATYVETHKTDFAALDIERKNILAASHAAIRTNMPDALLRMTQVLSPFMALRGEYRESSDLLKRAQDMALALADGTLLAATQLHLGRLAELRGEYALAAQLYDAGLMPATAPDHRRHHQHQQMRIALLAHRADVALCAGDSREAERLTDEALALIDQIGDRQHSALLYRIQAQIAGNRGEVSVGDILYPQALQMAEDVQDVETAIVCLQNMGVIAFKRGQYEQALRCFDDGFDRAKQVGHIRRMTALQNAKGCLIARYALQQREGRRTELFQQAERLYKEAYARAIRYELTHWQNSILQNLGALERDCRRYAQAEQYLAQALTIARQLGDRWLIGETECERGALYLETQQIEEAIAAYEQALAVANEDGDTELELAALAWYGLSRAWAAKGEKNQALVYAQRSLQQLTHLEFERKREVQDWLMALSSR